MAKKLVSIFKHRLGTERGYLEVSNSEIDPSMLIVAIHQYTDERSGGPDPHALHELTLEDLKELVRRVEESSSENRRES